jgi:CRP/FNR family transcriptional regulator, cyclic AMP receptor protein
MTPDERFVLMRNYDMFSCITDDEYEELDLVHNFLESKKGDYIYFDSHCLDKLFFLKGGYIKIGYINDKGNEIIKEIINEGEVFGQFTLEKNNLNGEFAQAHKSDVSLCAFKIDDFEKLLKKKPELAIEYSKQVGKKLRKTEFRLVNMLNKDVRARLLGFFYHLIMQDGYDGSYVSHSIDNFLTHDDIARLIGSARQTVTTAINQLEDDGYIKITRQKIYAANVKALEKLVIVT